MPRPRGNLLDWQLAGDSGAVLPGLSPEGRGNGTKQGKKWAHIMGELATTRHTLDQLVRSHLSLQATIGQVHTNLDAFIGMSGSAEQPPSAPTSTMLHWPYEDPDSLKDVQVHFIGPTSKSVQEPCHAQALDQVVCNSPRRGSNHTTGTAESTQALLHPSRTMAEQELRKVLQLSHTKSEVARQKSKDMKDLLADETSTCMHRIMSKMKPKRLEIAFDSIIGLVVFINAIFIGISIDSVEANRGIILAIQFLFTAIFWFEVLLKLGVHGWREQYLGTHAPANWFDLVLTTVDTVQIIFLLFFADQLDDFLHKAGFFASMFRIVRLLRLARVLRVLRSQVFQDLLAMIQGMVGAVSTLAWAVILFVLVIYVVSLVFRESLGPEMGLGQTSNDDEIGLYFQSVPRSMFTVFRCSFGDCTTSGGTPIFEHVTRIHGGFWSLVYSGFLFLVVIGVFNVISAIFVQATLAAAEEIALKKRRMRLEDEVRWATHLWALLEVLMKHARCDDEAKIGLTPGSFLEQINEMSAMEFDRALFDKVLLEEKSAVLALDGLDIDPQDHRYLSDILDPDNSGTICVLELVDGLKRLRGEPRRSDIIAVDLMVRSLQEKIEEIGKCMKDLFEPENPEHASAWRKSAEQEKMPRPPMPSLPSGLPA